MNQVLKFAVVGCGNIGTRHLAVIDAHPQARIAAVCDIEVDKCRECLPLYGDVPCFSDFSAMLEQTDAEVVNICTPHGLHAPMSIAAARAGKHVLVEKPMALTLAECEAMIGAARSSGVQLMVVKQNRYNIPIALTKQALDGKRLGRVFLVQSNVLWNRNESYYRNSAWRGRKKLEGGALYTQVSHFLDLLIWWFGDVVSAQTQIETFNHDIEIEDYGSSQLTFASGVKGSILWTTCVYNKNYEGSITIIGEKGIIKIGGQYLNKIEFWDVQSYPLPEDVEFVDKPNLYGKYQGTSSNHDKVMNDVVGDLLHERRHTVQGDEGMKTINAIELLYRNTPLQRMS
jgi:UDP-N-acetyl-2-amino-2-deoxyglucuronate dehydrogenase